MKSEIDYNKFQWHFGVVENRHDPFKLGRIQVRFYGVHSEDLSDVATADLPWATLINSPNNASTSGVGGPTTGIVEGAWVIGFFADQTKYQKPFILGTIPGIPFEEPDFSKGFSDPKQLYPRLTANTGLNELKESDLSRLSRSAFAEEHLSLKKKRASRIEKIPTAKAPEVTIQDNKASASYENITWDEPHPRGHDGTLEGFLYPNQYPYNHVYESETGHVKEVDDNIGNERLHDYHKSGTFTEIQPDGSKVHKIVGSDYDITVKDRNVQIGGNLNITVLGDAKLLIRGDKYEEIDGNYFLTVRKDMITKIQGNELKEVLTDKVTQVNGNTAFRVGDENNTASGHEIRTILASETITVGGTHTETITGDATHTILSNRKTIVGGTETLAVAKTGDMGFANNLNIGTAKNLNIKSTNATKLIAGTTQLINAGSTQTLTSTTQAIEAATGTIDYTTTGSIDVAAGNITDTGIVLNSHTHGGSATAPTGAIAATGAPVAPAE